MAGKTTIGSVCAPETQKLRARREKRVRSLKGQISKARKDAEALYGCCLTGMPVNGERGSRRLVASLGAKEKVV